jgi:hypothetical protein
MQPQSRTHNGIMTHTNRRTCERRQIAWSDELPDVPFEHLRLPVRGFFSFMGPNLPDPWSQVDMILAKRFFTASMSIERTGSQGSPFFPMPGSPP